MDDKKQTGVNIEISEIRTCSGLCFSVGIPAHLTIREPSNQGLTIVSRTPEQQSALDQLYTPLKFGQTRLLRLHPSQETGAVARAELAADLIVVNLHHADSSRSAWFCVGDRKKDVSYRALSHIGGSPIAYDVIKCNGVSLPITQHISSVLRGLSHSYSRMYVWIDAICIDQRNKREMAEHALLNFRIFAKATSVVVWIGEPDMDYVLASACIRDNLNIRLKLQGKTPCVSHSRQCQAQLKAIYCALIRFYDRPWLKHSWIRQELFASRRVVIHVGSRPDEKADRNSHLLKWHEFAKAAALIDRLRRFIPDDIRPCLEIESRVIALLQDTKELVPRSVKWVRKDKRAKLASCMKPAERFKPLVFSEALLHAKDRKVAKEEDSVYSILGMCAVSAQAIYPYDSGPRSEEVSLTVDYAKSVRQVYEETTTYILNKHHNPDDLVNLWNFMEKPIAYREHYPKWVMNWCSSRCSKEDLETIRTNIDKSFVYHVDHTAIDLPHPIVQPQDPHPVLEIRAFALNYVAHLTPYTCDISSFLSSPNGGFTLSKHGNYIHTPIHKPICLCNLFSSLPANVHFFNTEIHNRRIAILGAANDQRIALVPASAQKGDILIGGIASHRRLLPMLLHPLNPDPTKSGFFGKKDPWDCGNRSTRRKRMDCLRASFYPRMDHAHPFLYFGCARLLKWFCYAYLLFLTLLCGAWAFFPWTHSHSDLAGLGAPVTMVGAICLIVGRYYWRGPGKIRERARRVEQAEEERRKEVLGLLERVTEGDRLGEEFDFVGPVFVRVKGNKEGYGAEQVERTVQGFVVH